MSAERTGAAGASEQVGNGFSVDDEGISFPAAVDPSSTYDVLLNDRHVWSLRPERDAVAGRRTLTAQWPDALRRFLAGQAEVTVRAHVSGEVVATMRHDFAGDSSRVVDVSAARGDDLLLDKRGRLIRPLSSEDSALVEELMDVVERLLDTLRDVCGVPSYICYGTLLGAVRNGQLIGHDNDLDVAYVSSQPHPVDVAREGLKIERALREEGWDVRRGSAVRLNVRNRMSDNSIRCVDVFTSHWVDDVLYMPSDTGFRLPREVILPLGTAELMGRAMPAPADPERLLEATYGPTWEVPDPSFIYETPEWLSRRLTGWFGGLVTNRKAWDTFNANAGKWLRNTPSPFARWVAETYPSDRHLLDLGSGTARDSKWFAGKHGRQVTGVDYCMSAVNGGKRASVNQGLDASFELLNLYDTRSALTLGARLAREPEPVDVYARFMLHALDASGQENLLRLASMALRRGGLLFLEFRTPRDEGKHHVFGEHFRAYREPDEVAAEIEALGGRVLHLEEGTGLAPFRGEDPDIGRIVATWAS